MHRPTGELSIVLAYKYELINLLELWRMICKLQDTIKGN